MAQRIGSFKTVVLSIDANNAVATLRLARPDKSNAVTLNMLEEISQALKLCEGSVRALVLHAEGKNFCGGLDFEALGSILQVSSSTTCPGAARDALRVSILAMQVRFGHARYSRVLCRGAHARCAQLFQKGTRCCCWVLHSHKLRVIGKSH